jgi:predicted porin
MPGLKAAVVYNRNTVGTNTALTGVTATTATGMDTNKGSNNQVWAGVSYRFGNNEPRLSYASSSNTSYNGGTPNDGANQWTANWGYYLSKRTQVYGLVSTIKNNQNGVYTMASGGTNLNPTAGQSLVTYGAGLRTNF